MLRRRFALCPLCLWPLSKFHVRNRHKSYGHILNLCAALPLSPPSIFLACLLRILRLVLWLRLLSLRHFDCRRGSWRFHIDFCCVPLIEFPSLRCCSCCCFCPTKFFNQKKVGASLKPSVARGNVLIRSVHMKS